MSWTSVIRARPLSRGSATFAVLPAILAIHAAPSHSQTFDEAVRANAAVGIQLCAAGAPELAAWARSFTAAGFAERVERSNSNSDTTHYFTAPADTVTVELYYGEMPESCQVKTDHLGVTAMSQVLDGIAPQIVPGYQRGAVQGPPDPATGQPALCVRYRETGTDIPHTIGVWPAGNAENCIENGSAMVSEFYAV